MSRSPIPNFTTGNYQVTRRTQGAFDRGRYVPGSPETLTIKGSLQPIGGRDIKQLQEGERIADHFTFYSDVAPSIIDTKTLGDADVITIDGETYRVVSVQGWGDQAGFRGIDLPHFKTILKREPQQ